MRTRAPMMAVMLATGCYAVQVNESVENVDTLLEETPRQEYTGEPELVHDVESTGTILAASTSVAHPCARWTEQKVRRVEHTARTLLRPTESAMNGLLVYGGAAFVAGVGYGIYGTTLDEAEAPTAYALGAAGVSVGSVLLGNWLHARHRSRDSYRDLGAMTLEDERAQGACDPSPLSEATIEMPLGLSTTTDLHGSWTIDLGVLEDDPLGRIASHGIVVKAIAADQEYVSAVDDATVRQAAAAELERRVAEQQAREAEEAARAQEAALAALPDDLERYRGPWKLTSERSPVDDSLTIVATMQADRTITGWPGKRVRPSLTLRCMEGRTDAYIYTGFTPQVEQHGFSFDHATMILRLDKEPAFEARGSKSSSGEALFLPDPIGFMRSLTEHQSLYFQFVPFNSNPAETTFELTGADQVVAFIRLGCGW